MEMLNGRWASLWTPLFCSLSSCPFSRRFPQGQSEILHSVWPSSFFPLFTTCTTVVSGEYFRTKRRVGDSLADVLASASHILRCSNTSDFSAGVNGRQLLQNFTFHLQTPWCIQVVTLQTNGFGVLIWDLESCYTDDPRRRPLWWTESSRTWTLLLLFSVACESGQTDDSEGRGSPWALSSL